MEYGCFIHKAGWPRAVMFSFRCSICIKLWPGQNFSTRTMDDRVPDRNVDRGYMVNMCGKIGQLDSANKYPVPGPW